MSHETAQLLSELLFVVFLLVYFAPDTIVAIIKAIRSRNK